MRKFWQSAAVAGVAAFGLASVTAAQAADYPAKPITLVAPYGPGGASDLHARIVAGTAPHYIGQAVLVIAVQPLRCEIAHRPRVAHVAQKRAKTFCALQ